MRLHPAAPLIAYTRLVHLWVVLVVLILRRACGANDGCIDDGAVADHQSALTQMAIHQPKQPLAQSMTLYQPPDPTHRCLIQRRFATRICARKLPPGLEPYSTSSTSGSDKLNHCCERRYGKSAPSLPGGIPRPGAWGSAAQPLSPVSAMELPAPYPREISRGESSCDTSKPRCRTPNSMKIRCSLWPHIRRVHQRLPR